MPGGGGCGCGAVSAAGIAFLADALSMSKLAGAPLGAVVGCAGVCCCRSTIGIGLAVPVRMASKTLSCNYFACWLCGQAACFNSFVAAGDSGTSSWPV